MLLFDPEDPASFKAVHDLGERMAMKAIELDGTCTGEHGIGLGESTLCVPCKDEYVLNTERVIYDGYCYFRQERPVTQGARERMCLGYEGYQVGSRPAQHPEPHENI